MITDKEIYINIKPANLSFWKNKGYIAVLGKQCLVKIDDLPRNSNVYVSCICGLCQEKFLQRYSRNTDTCSKCRQKQRILPKAKPKYQKKPKEELETLYFKKKFSIEDLRYHYNVSRPVIVRWFKEYNIIPRNDLFTEKPSKEELENLHKNLKFPLKKIAIKYKVGTAMIKRWFKEYNINQDYHRSKRKFIPSKDTLIQHHIIEKLSLKDIAEIYNVSDVLVGLWFKEYEITDQIIYRNNSKYIAEDTIKNILNSYGFSFNKTRNVISPYELDLYDEQRNIAIEYCGLYWHSNKDKRYHLNKLNLCKAKGIQLLTIFEDEWLSKEPIVISIIKSKLGISDRIYARSSIAKSIPKNEARLFLKDNHLQEQPNNIIHAFGLYHKDELVGVMTFGKHHRGKSILVLNRLCFAKNIVVLGGAEKLFKLARQHITEDILTWSDNRWSNGNVYEKLGFIKQKILDVDYSYIKNQKRYSKQSMKKSLVGCPPEIKEIEFNKSRGFGVIWDCGKTVWLFKNSP